MKTSSLVFLFALTCVFSNAQKQEQKPLYAGHIEYCSGGFGTFSYPVKGDSILVFLKDSTISLEIFSPKDPKNVKYMEGVEGALYLVKKTMYENIITPDKILPTGNYDMKFATKNKNSHGRYTLYLTHFGNGSTAQLTLLQEDGGVRLDDLFIADIRRLK